VGCPKSRSGCARGDANSLKAAEMDRCLFRERQLVLGRFRLFGVSPAVLRNVFRIVGVHLASGIDARWRIGAAGRSVFLFADHKGGARNRRCNRMAVAAGDGLGAVEPVRDELAALPAHCLIALRRGCAFQAALHRCHELGPVHQFKRSAFQTRAKAVVSISRSAGRALDHAQESNIIEHIGQEESRIQPLGEDSKPISRQHSQ
jgi:hypothetical protein